MPMGTPPVPTGVGHVVRVVCVVAVTVAPGPPGAAVAELLPVKEAEVELLVTGSSSSMSSPGRPVAVGSAVSVAVGSAVPVAVGWAVPVAVGWAVPVAVGSAVSVAVVLGETEEVAEGVGPAVIVTGERPVAKLVMVRVWTASNE